MSVLWINRMTNTMISSEKWVKARCSRIMRHCLLTCYRLLLLFQVLFGSYEQQWLSWPWRCFFRWSRWLWKEIRWKFVKNCQEYCHVFALDWIEILCFYRYFLTEWISIANPFWILYLSQCLSSKLFWQVERTLRNGGMVHKLIQYNNWRYLFW